MEDHGCRISVGQGEKVIVRDQVRLPMMRKGRLCIIAGQVMNVTRFSDAPTEILVLPLEDAEEHADDLVESTAGNQ